MKMDRKRIVEKLEKLYAGLPMIPTGYQMEEIERLEDILNYVDEVLMEQYVPIPHPLDYQDRPRF